MFMCVMYLLVYVVCYIGRLVLQHAPQRVDVRVALGGTTCLTLLA